MSISSDEVNFLVYRYLQESGFLHSAFAFGYESFVHKTNINGNSVPPGALISFIQKGLQYLELEANLNEEGEVPSGEYSPLTPQEMLTNDVDDLKVVVKDRREAAQKEKDRERAKERDREERERAEREVEREREEAYPKRNFDEDNQISPMEEDDDNDNHESSAKAQPPSSSSSGRVLISDSEVTTLSGHTSEVFICAWSPASSLLASGSGDSTARIWGIGDGPCGEGATVKEVTLKHFKRNMENKQEKSKDVTTLDWNGDGSLLATGSYDGQARIWSRDGKLKNTLNKHKGPIFSLKWNKKGDYLLSGSVDHSAIIWDAKTGEVKQEFKHHTAPTLDVDWRNNISFATCSTDQMIYVCKLGESAHLKKFQGHKDEVNAIKWDPTGTLLASCSDDKTAKIWSLKQDTCVHDFSGHTKEIYTIKWSPTGPNSNNPNQNLILASASFDATIKIWDIEKGVCIHNLTEHTDPVYSVAFSPNGEYLASGSFDKCLHIWSTKDGSLVRTYHGNGGIFEVCWNKDGDKVAACFSDNRVCVIDFKADKAYS
mmetsp:Transcript_4165/g.8569  ORF Transcript_4165/g.8569 Transcript_4165/m.8569 type:complete len:544 (-) Transcript_4165:229-1860(-)|eukprot:CAMPEP_0118935396 /NCGR_PEP_ID=MMETSP1169-20130426/15621_1 /TAXON_ID=36882 /ORGANISM="Pyramimonas obovata, Strain CCMP722" /LENGTH=543 /DNA_ID=CAMNT_0006878433 /DNA_START=536 /DNA_END=2167 /DNA_ORIENTATION=-